MKDLQSKIDPVRSVAPAAHTATVNGTGVDLQGFNSAAVVFDTGTIADGTHTPKLQESDDNGTWTDVASANQVGALSNLATDTIQKVGYKGVKRYIRAVVTVSGATSGGVYGAQVVRGNPENAPV